MNAETINYNNTPTIKTENLILRRFTEEDIPYILEIHRDKDVNKYLPWFPLETIKDAELFYRERLESNYLKSKGYNYAICLKEKNTPIGYINLSMDDSHDFGYGLRKDMWNRGIVTEAAKAVIDRLKKDGIEYITATHDINNIASGIVMQNLGMKYCYSYIEQWMPKNIEVTFRMYQLNLDGNTERIYKKYWDISDKKFVENNIYNR